MELRKDYILDKYTAFAESRKGRPKEFKHEEVKNEGKVCFFCPGNEHTTPPEIGRIQKGDSWKLRWFPNKFPAVSKEGSPEIKSDNRFFTWSSAYGSHEVIVETPNHHEQLWDLPKEHIKEVLEIYKQRIAKLSKEDNIKYVLLFKNHGREAGTSLVHSHTQITSLNFIPPAVTEELTAVRKYDFCPYCDIINIEKGSDRRAFENDTFAAFTPYASRFNYELWLFPKRHIGTIQELTEQEMWDLSEILHKALAKLKELNLSFNYFIHYAPHGNDLHFHIEITPRSAIWAGFEIGGGAIINSVPPESAAAFYRGEL